MDRIPTDHILEILRPLLLTHSPTGREDEAVAWVMQWLQDRSVEASRDLAGNVIVLIKGTGAHPPCAVVAHLDEIGFIVKRIEPDGRIRVSKLGGSYPWKYGEGPVELLGRGDPTPGFLCFGSMHASEESAEIWAARHTSPLKWEMVWIDAKLSTSELMERGIHPGVKGVVARSRKSMFEIGDWIGGYALDDKALVAILLAILERLKEAPPPRDVYLIASVGEEIGSGRAAFAAGNIPAETLLALEVAPVLPEYNIAAGPHPVILYKDEYNVYDESVCVDLERSAFQVGLFPQRAVLSSFGSDLSFGARSGRFARYGCISVPCENTHGYEIIHRESLASLALGVEAWIRGM